MMAGAEPCSSFSDPVIVNASRTSTGSPKINNRERTSDVRLNASISAQHPAPNRLSARMKQSTERARRALRFHLKPKAVLTHHANMMAA